MQTKSYTINPGFEPQLTAAERQWLEGHNQRREEYHGTEGTPFNRLVWSKELADQASNWIDEITPACKMVREPVVERSAQRGAGHHPSAVGGQQEGLGISRESELDADRLEGEPVRRVREQGGGVRGAVLLRFHLQVRPRGELCHGSVRWLGGSHVGRSVEVWPDLSR